MLLQSWSVLAPSRGWSVLWSLHLIGRLYDSRLGVSVSGSLLRNREPAPGFVPRNPGTHDDLSQNERENTVNLNWFPPISIFHFSSL